MTDFLRSSHDVENEVSAGQGLLLLDNASIEVLDDISQGFYVGIIGENRLFRGEAADFYFLFWSEVIEEEEFLRVEKEELAASVGERPAIPDVYGDALHVKLDEGCVAESGVEDVDSADGAYGEWLVENGSQDRNVVEGEVFDDVHAADVEKVEDALEVVEAKVVAAANGLDELQLREKALLDKLADFEGRRVEDKRGVNHQDQAVAFGEGAELPRFVHSLGGRFGDDDVPAIEESFTDEAEVRLGRSDHGDAVYVRSVPQLPKVFERLKVPLSEGLPDALGVFVEGKNLRKR